VGDFLFKLLVDKRCSCASSHPPTPPLPPSACTQCPALRVIDQARVGGRRHQRRNAADSPACTDCAAASRRCTRPSLASARSGSGCGRPSHIAQANAARASTARAALPRVASAALSAGAALLEPAALAPAILAPNPLE
jgi:hypothetical protein